MPACEAASRLQRHRADAVPMASYRKLAEDAARLRHDFALAPRAVDMVPMMAVITCNRRASG
jgi:hypothetical protein